MTSVEDAVISEATITEATKEVANEFAANLEDISSDFVAFFGLKHKKEVVNLSDSFFRWMDFRLRYVDPKPRTVYVSKKLNRPLPFTVRRPLENLFYMLQKGDDVNPYQGKGLVLHHDTSGKSRYNRTDLLWADWGIIHFHLSMKRIQHGRYFCEPSDWLLFAMVGEDFVACIDVRSHKETNVFSNPELIHIAVESWPELMERFKMSGLHVPDAPLTPEQHKLFRKSGIMGYVSVGEDIYMGPSMGISTASTSSRVTMSMNNIVRYARELANLVCATDGQFQNEVRASGCAAPKFRLCVTPMGLAVYETTMDKAWVLPRRQLEEEKNYLADLHDSFAPEWAVSQILEKTKTPSRMPVIEDGRY